MADSVLPRCKPGVRKHFWSDELDQLKTDSFNAFRLWEDVGRPKHGTVYLNKVSCSLNYKRALRRAKSKKDLGHGEILSDYLTHGDDNMFWKTWRKLQDKPCLPPRIEGESCDADIVKTFSKHFSDIYNSVDLTLSGSSYLPFLSDCVHNN